jgi:hypothetical protein
VQLIAALVIAMAVLAYLVLSPSTRRSSQAPQPERRQTQFDAVKLNGGGRLHIEPGSALEKNLQILRVEKRRVSVPQVMVTGAVAASLRPGTSPGKDTWQFNSPEVLTIYSDWRKASADISFAEAQYERVKELAATRIKSQREIVERLRKTVAAGTDTVKDLRLEETNLLQFIIQEKKDLNEADTAILIAKRNEATFARQLQQLGLEPSLLRETKSDVDIVMADVPENKAARVKAGQGCQAKFFGLPGTIFDGKVNGIAPVLSKERRTLRVLFAIDDPNDQLRPGMFAEIGLGTDPRDVLLISSDSLIHIGRSDYVLVEEGTGTWRVAEVQAGEAFGLDVEIIAGVQPDERVIGKGAVLLKPIVVRALQSLLSESIRNSNRATLPAAVTEGKP